MSCYANCPLNLFTSTIRNKNISEFFASHNPRKYRYRLPNLSLSMWIIFKLVAPSHSVAKVILVIKTQVNLAGSKCADKDYPFRQVPFTIVSWSVFFPRSCFSFYRGPPVPADANANLLLCIVWVYACWMTSVVLLLVVVLLINSNEPYYYIKYTQ